MNSTFDFPMLEPLLSLATILVGVLLVGVSKAEPKESVGPTVNSTGLQKAEPSQVSCSALNLDALRLRMKSVHPGEPKQADGKVLLAADRMEIVSTPFIRGGAIFRIIVCTPSGSSTEIIGCVDGGAAWRLGYGQQSFYEYFASVSLDLSTQETRQAYFSLYQEVFHGAKVLVGFDSLIGELSVSNANAKAFKKLRQRYGKRIVPPLLAGEPPWRATAYTLRHDRLVRIDFSLTPEGRVDEKETVMENHLPVLQRV